MNDTGDVTENGEQDVNKDIAAAPTLEEHTQRRKDDGKDDLADIRGGKRHRRSTT